MLRRQVRITHGHGQRGMAQDLFQRHDMPAAHDEVSREGVAQYVAGLPFEHLKRGQLYLIPRRYKPQESLSIWLRCSRIAVS